LSQGLPVADHLDIVEWILVLVALRELVCQFASGGSGFVAHQLHALLMRLHQPPHRLLRINRHVLGRAARTFRGKPLGHQAGKHVVHARARHPGRARHICRGPTVAPDERHVDACLIASQPNAHQAVNRNRIGHRAHVK
jgi:hypothetical protein